MMEISALFLSKLEKKLSLTFESILSDKILK